MKCPYEYPNFVVQLALVISADFFFFDQAMSHDQGLCEVQRKTLFVFRSLPIHNIVVRLLNMIEIIVKRNEIAHAFCLE